MSASNTWMLVGSSSVLTAIVNQVIVWFLGARTRGQTEIKEGKFAALYLAIALESYARACAMLISESEIHDGSGGAGEREYHVVSTLPDYSATVEWKALGIDMTTNVMDFRVRVDNALARIPDPNEDEDDFARWVREESASLGVAALALAKELRGRLKRPLVNDCSDGWVRRYLAERMSTYAEDRLKREMTNACLNEELFATVAEDTQPTPSD